MNLLEIRDSQNLSKQALGGHLIRSDVFCLCSVVSLCLLLLRCSRLGSLFNLPPSLLVRLPVVHLHHNLVVFHQ